MNARQSQRRIVPIGAILAAIIATSTVPSAGADVPAYMQMTVLDQQEGQAKGEEALDTLSGLNEGMFPVHEKSMALFKKHLRERIPLIIAMSDAAGGNFALYRPGKDAPLMAPPPPAVYKMAKFVAHSELAVYELLAPYCNSSEVNKSWVGQLRVYRIYIQNASNSIDRLENVSDQQKALFKKTLNDQVLPFVDKCLSKSSFNYDDLITFAHSAKPEIQNLIEIAASAQVAHWYRVLEQWKEMLGPDWGKTYALVNCSYVNRQNNIFFTILVQLMGEKAINDRLLLMETSGANATREDMINAFVHILSDRALAKSFFGNDRLMDHELLGGAARSAIKSEATKRGQQAILPPLVPFNSNQWANENRFSLRKRSIYS